MNISIFVSFLKLVLRLEKHFGVQQALVGFSEAFAALNGNPGDAEQQRQFKSAFTKLVEKINSLEANLDPKSEEIIEMIGGQKWFTRELVDRLNDVIDSNRITLSLASEEIQKIVEERQAFVSTLQVSSGSFSKLRIEEYKTDAKRPEVGFEIPREIFNNELPEFRKELLQIQLIVKAAQRLHRAEQDPIELTTISTSDPTIYVQVVWPVMVTIGGLFTWALDTLERGLRIKKAWSETSGAGLIDKKALEDFFRPQIEAAVEKAISDKINSLVQESEHQFPGETKSTLHSVLRAVLSRAERGMRVDLRFSLPPPPAEGEGAEPDQFADIRPYVDKAKNIQSALRQSVSTDDPLLSLEFVPELQPEETSTAKNSVHPKSQKRRAPTKDPDASNQGEDD